MGFTEILTIVFVVLKLTGNITWNWGLVFLPEIIALSIYFVTVVILVVTSIRTRKRIEKKYNDIFKDF